MTENNTLINPSDPGKYWEKLSLRVISNCPKLKKEREKAILAERFGIGKSKKTLNTIGLKYGVTRERIRQIVNNSLKKIRKFCPDSEALKRIGEIEDFIAKNGGFASQSAIFNHYHVSDRSEQNALVFVVNLSRKLEVFKESDLSQAGWNLPKLKQLKIRELMKSTTLELKSIGKTVKTGELAKKINASEELLSSVMESSKQIMRTDDGRWGLAIWPQVNPKSIRDKSKYIMIRHKKPMHYADLTKIIGEIGLKNVTKQSVHNELIKNRDFVLVGRGIYALSEWGYKPGVVEDVIIEVLTEAGEPLHKNIIIEKVLEKRIVKASTVILNLQKSTFKRVGKAVYTLN